MIIRKKDYIQVSSVILATGETPQIRLNSSAADASDNDRSMLGQATANNFVSSSATGDTVLRGNSTGNLLFGVGTAEKVRITSDGRFGFGTNANIDERGHIRLHVTCSRYKLEILVLLVLFSKLLKRFDVQAQNNFFQIYDSTVLTERLRITSDGNGIGTDNPNRKLVVQDSGNTFLSVKAGTSDDVGVIFGD